jgi:hypothetical protein
VFVVVCLRHVVRDVALSDFNSAAAASRHDCGLFMFSQKRELSTVAHSGVMFSASGDIILAAKYMIRSNPYVVGLFGHLSTRQPCVSRSFTS